MVWVCIALAIPLLVLLLLHLLRFHFTVAVETPSVLRGSVGVTFLKFRREVIVDAAHAVMGHQDDKVGEEDDEDEEGLQDAKGAARHTEAGSGGGGTSDGKGREGVGPEAHPPGGERGAIRIPDAWIQAARRVRTRLRKAARKWVLDIGVWKILWRFTWKSGRRVVGLLHPAIESLHLSLEDVFSLGRIAAAWSVAAGTLPALACPTEFGFAQPFAFRTRVAGGFSGLNFLLFALLTLFSFPWAPLAGRFAHCWRDPRLNRWQRRVLLP